MDKDKTKNEPLTADTIIGSRKIYANEFRKFFKKTLGDDYEKYPLAMDIIKMSSNHEGKTLKDIIDECYNPSGGKTLEETLSENRFNITSESDKAFIIALEKAMNEMGYGFDCIIGTNIKFRSIGTKTKSCPIGLKIKENGISLRFKLFKIDPHRQYIESTPAHIKEAFVFNGGDCKLCHPKCGPGKIYTIDGQRMQKCNHKVFYFKMPTIEKIPDYMDLLSEFFPKNFPKKK